MFSFLKDVSKFFIVLAMAAIGLNTDIVKLVKTGGKPIAMGFCCWVGITAVSLLMQHGWASGNICPRKKTEERPGEYGIHCDVYRYPRRFFAL